MAFSLQKSQSVLLPNPAGSVADFTAKTAIGSIRFSNTTNANKTIDVWFDYDGTAATDTEKVHYAVSIPKNTSVVMPGVFVFVSGGRITASCSVANAVTMHYTSATF